MKYLITLIIVLSSIICVSQTYPKIEIDSSGNKFVVMTLEQAQKVDNNMEMLILLERSIVDCDNLNNSYIKVIDGQKRLISLLQIDVEILKQQSMDKDLLISNIQERLDNSIQISMKCDSQKSELNNKVTILEDEITRLKVKRNVGYGVGVVGLISLILLSILR